MSWVQDEIERRRRASEAARQQEEQGQRLSLAQVTEILLKPVFWD